MSIHCLGLLNLQLQKGGSFEVFSLVSKFNWQIYWRCTSKSSTFEQGMEKGLRFVYFEYPFEQSQILCEIWKFWAERNEWKRILQRFLEYSNGDWVSSRVSHRLRCWVYTVNGLNAGSWKSHIRHWSMKIFGVIEINWRIYP